MEENLAQKVELTAFDESGIVNGVVPSLAEDPSKPLNFVENSDSRAENSPAKGASAPTPVRVPPSLWWLLCFGSLLLSCGTWMKFIAEKPLVYHQWALWRGRMDGDTQTTPKVAVAIRAIAPGQLFTSDNVSMEPIGNRTTRYPVYYSPNLWGARCESGIAAGAVIDARSVGPVLSQPGLIDSKLKYYAIVSNSVKAGDSMIGNVNYVAVQEGEGLPAGAFVTERNSHVSTEMLQDLTPGKVLLRSQIKKVP